MPRRCTICSHPKRPAVDAELVAARPYRRIAARYGLAASSLVRHHDEHLPAALAQASRAAEVARGDDLVDRLLELARETRSILAAARLAGNDELALKAIARAERQVEIQGRLIGQIQESTTVNVVLSVEWLTIRELVVAALDPFPDARLAVAAALGPAHARAA